MRRLTKAFSQIRFTKKIVVACILSSLLAGCTVVGPAAIRGGRHAYNAAITETNNQQMLMVYVHNRYEESNQLLSVASVTANVSVTSGATLQAGFGNKDDYRGNLVPFSGGFVYEENPTISYVPVTGETYLRQVTSPIPLSLLAQMTRSLPYPEHAYTMLVSRINGIRNPAFLYGSQQDDPRFERLVTLMTELKQEHCLHWISDPSEPEALSLLLQPSSPKSVTQVKELTELLGLGKLELRDGKLVIPVSSDLKAAGTGTIVMTTRTLWELIEMITAAVEVPVEDEQNGYVASFPRPGPVGRQLRIHYSESAPEQAYTAVEYRDGWFYIDRRDRATKGYFKLLGSLWSAAMARSINTGAATPVLTVPVSR